MIGRRFFFFLGAIDWKVSDSELVKERGLATVTLNHVHFTPLMGYISFSLYGLATFNHCSFSGGRFVSIHIHGSNHEPAPTEENVRSFQSYVANKPIRVHKSEFRDIFISVYNTTTARKVTIIDCRILFLAIRMPGKEDHDLSLFFLHVIGSFSGTAFHVHDTKKKSFIFINLININMSDVTVTSSVVHSKGKIGLNTENATWVNNNEGFIDLHNVVSVNIVSSKLILNCDACSPMIFYGLNVKRNSPEYYFRNDIAHVQAFHLDIEKVNIAIVSIIETDLKIHTSL